MPAHQRTQPEEAARGEHTGTVLSARRRQAMRRTVLSRAALFSDQTGWPQHWDERLYNGGTGWTRRYRTAPESTARRDVDDDRLFTRFQSIERRQRLTDDDMSSFASCGTVG